MIYNNWSYMYGKIKKNNCLTVCWSFAKLSDISTDLIITNSYSIASISNLCEEIIRFYSQEYHTPSRNMLWIMSALIYGLILIYQYQVNDIYNLSHLLYVKSNELIILKEIEKKLSSSNRQSITDIQNENEITETALTEQQMIDEPDQNLIADINLITLNEVYETYNNNNNHDIIEYELEDMSSVDILGFCQYLGTSSNISKIRRELNKSSSLDDSHIRGNHTINQTFDIESSISIIPNECHLINTTQRLTITSQSQEIQPLAYSNNGHTQVHTSILPELSDAMNAIDSSMNISNCIESNVSDRNQIHNTISTDINRNDINESIPLKRSAGTDDCLTVRSEKRVKKQNRYLIIDTIIKQEISFPITNAVPKCKHIDIENLKKKKYNFKQIIKPHIEDEQNILNLIFDKPILQNILPSRPNFTPESYQQTQPTNCNNIQTSSIQNTAATAILTNNELNEIDVLNNECNKNILDSINLHKCNDKQNEVMLKLIHLWRNNVYPIGMKVLLSNNNKMKAIHIFFNIIVLSGRSWDLLKIEKKENTNEIFHIGPSEKLNIHF